MTKKEKSKKPMIEYYNNIMVICMNAIFLALFYYLYNRKKNIIEILKNITMVFARL